MHTYILNITTTCCHLTNLPMPTMPTIAHNHPPLLLVCNTSSINPHLAGTVTNVRYRCGMCYQAQPQRVPIRV